MDKKKIFISYSRNDHEYVAKLVEALRNKGMSVWFDSHIRSGSQWDEAIEREINAAEVLVTVLSKSSVQSDNVKDEVSYAIDLGKTISPIRIEDCTVPMRLRRYQYIDFTRGMEWGVERLIHDISHPDGDVQPPKPPPPPKPKPIPRPAPPPEKTNYMVPFLIGGGIVGIIGIGIIIFLVMIADLSEEDYYDEPGTTFENSLTQDQEAGTNEKYNREGMVIYQDPQGRVTVNIVGDEFADIGDILYANSSLEVFNVVDGSSTGDMIAVGQKMVVQDNDLKYIDGYYYITVRYADSGF